MRRVSRYETRSELDTELEEYEGDGVGDGGGVGRSPDIDLPPVVVVVRSEECVMRDTQRVRRQWSWSDTRLEMIQSMQQVLMNARSYRSIHAAAPICIASMARKLYLR